jgi:hypothetical protein
MAQQQQAGQQAAAAPAYEKGRLRGMGPPFSMETEVKARHSSENSIFIGELMKTTRS